MSHTAAGGEGGESVRVKVRAFEGCGDVPEICTVFTSFRLPLSEAALGGGGGGGGGSGSVTPVLRWRLLAVGRRGGEVAALLSPCGHSSAVRRYRKMFRRTYSTSSARESERPIESQSSAVVLEREPVEKRIGVWTKHESDDNWKTQWVDIQVYHKVSRTGTGNR